MIEGSMLIFKGMLCNFLLFHLVKFISVDVDAQNTDYKAKFIHTSHNHQDSPIEYWTKICKHKEIISSNYIDLWFVRERFVCIKR